MNTLQLQISLCNSSVRSEPFMSAFQNHNVSLPHQYFLSLKKMNVPVPALTSFMKSSILIVKTQVGILAYLRDIHNKSQTRTVSQQLTNTPTSSLIVYSTLKSAKYFAGGKSLP